MGDVAIKIEGISKQYRIGELQKYKALRDTLADAMYSPFKLFHSIFGSSNTEDKGGNGTIWALKDVSFEIKHGEVVGIIGRNGAGKSTLLKILSRITEPTCGYAEIHGRVGSLLEVGTGFHPELTGRDNIYLNGAILGLRRAEVVQKFDEIVAFSGTEQFLDTPVKFYSSGMYMRLAFAVAAHLETEIVLVDEVLAVGDMAFQKKCLSRMGQVSKDGRTVLFVSHNISAILSLCNKVIYMADGGIRAIGAPQSIISSYLADVLANCGEDLERLRVQGYGKDVWFSEIKMVSNSREHLLFGQELVFELRVFSRRQVKHLSIGCTVFNDVGHPVGTLFTSETFSVEQGKQYYLRLLISNVSLAPGSYHAGFSIGYGGLNGMRHDLDIVIGSPAFRVLTLSEGEGAMPDWNRSWGNIVFKDAQLTVV